MLRNSVPYNGRPACMRCRWCVGFACEVDAKNGSQNTVLQTALHTGLLQLRTECMTKEIVTNAQGRATGVRYFDRNGSPWEQPARVVVSSCGAIESARLLLNSANHLSPNGLGNRYDWVGRNLQGHTYSGAYGMFDEVTYDDIGPGASIGISDFNHGNPGMRGGGVLCNEFIRLPYHVAGMRPPDVPRWGQGFKDWMRHAYLRMICVMGPTQEMPVYESRITLDPQMRDKFGIPVARISGPKHPHSLEISNVMANHAEAWLKEAGAVKTWLKLSGQGTSAGQHQAGTCRMGNDPKTSVVDRDCRVHDVDNVFVIDASVHVTNGGFNPVLTILANAYRVGERIAASGLKARG
jgi:choline dehydrogenase-like flavoprotein